MAQQAQSDTVVDINFQRYCNCIYVVAQRAVCRVFLYLYQHHQPDPQVYVGEALANTPGGFNRMQSVQKAALGRRENPVNMDITLLYMLLQRTCGLKPDPPQDSVWNNPRTEADTQRLEHQLYQIKELRNDLGHEPWKYMNLTKEQLQAKVNKLEELCCEVVKEASVRTGRSDDVQNATENIKMAFHEILTSTRSDDFLPQEWVALAREEQRLTQGPSKVDFCELQLRLPQGTWAVTSDQNTLPELLQAVDELLPQLILLTGPAGAGKTTLCQHAWDQWIARGGTGSGYDLMIWVQCSQVTTRDIARTLKEELLPHTCQLCDYSQVLRLLGSLRVFWLLDGLEDAAPEATHLLRGILDKFGDKHVVMVTCQPRYVQEATYLATYRRICTVSLHGLSKKGVNMLLGQLLEEQEYRRFVRDLSHLEDELIEELKNPLKLQLTAKLWLEGNLDMKMNTSLSHLYTKVEAALVDKVSRRLAEKWGLTTSEAHRRVCSWLRKLYNVAFTMTAENKLFVIDRTMMNELEEKSSLLLPSYTECLSAFLTCLPDAFSGVNHYRFIHMTQQRYLAAQHLCHLLLSHPTDPNTLTQALQLDQADEDKLDRLYDVLLQVLSSLVENKKLEEGLEEILITVFSKCKRCQWLEVVRCADHSHSVARRVSQHMPDIWHITDTNLEATMLVLTHITPATLNINIVSDPSHLPLLLPFVKQVALARVNVMLNMHSDNEYSDKYLQVLYDEKATCCVAEFSGPLTADGYLLFLTKPGIRILHAVVTDMKALQALVLITNCTSSLQEIEIIIRTTDLDTSLDLSVRPDIKVNVNLSHFQDEHIPLITKLLPRMSLKFNAILLFKMSAEGALKFVRELESSGVQVNTLDRFIILDASGTHDNIIVSYGSIPKQLSDSTFLACWRQPQLQVTVEITFSKA